MTSGCHSSCGESPHLHHPQPTHERRATFASSATPLRHLRRAPCGSPGAHSRSARSPTPPRARAARTYRSATTRRCASTRAASGRARSLGALRRCSAPATSSVTSRWRLSCASCRRALRVYGCAAPKFAPLSWLQPSQRCSRGAAASAATRTSLWCSTECVRALLIACGVGPWLIEAAHVMRHGSCCAGLRVGGGLCVQ